MIRAPESIKSDDAASLTHRISRVEILDVATIGRVALARLIDEPASPSVVISTRLLSDEPTEGARYVVVVFSGSVERELIDAIIESVMKGGNE